MKEDSIISHEVAIPASEAIMRAAEDEFLEKGFTGARTTSIAERAGVTHAMLHYYFRSKERLFEKVLDGKTAELRSVIFGFINEERLPLFECIEMGMRRHFDFIMRNPKLPLFIINEMHRDNSSLRLLADKFREMAFNVRDSLQAMIDEGAARGECKAADALMIMTDIISLNVFPFVARPLLFRILGEYDSASDLLHMKLEENIKTVLNRLKP